MTEIGTQLNEHHDENELLQLILDEVVELSGVQRAILLLKNESGEFNLLPLVIYSTKRNWIHSQRNLLNSPHASRAVDNQSFLKKLNLQPKNTDYLQRIRLAVPLLLRGQLLGVLYADMRRLFGKLNEEDLNLLSVLCNQAASALENAHLVSGLEQKVKERTEALQTSNTILGQRNTELQIINSIQQGLAAELDFQAIVDLVGDKLREVFTRGDLVINWYDEKANLIHFLYEYEHGKRLTIPPVQSSPSASKNNISRQGSQFSLIRLRMSKRTEDYSASMAPT